MFSAFITFLIPMVGPKVAKPLAIAAFIVAGIVLFTGLKSCYDGSVIEAELNEAAAEYLEKQNEVIGEADIASDERKAETTETQKTIEELSYEAVEKGCSLGEYVASNGVNCL